MSQSAKETAGRYARIAGAYAEVARRFPFSRCDTIGKEAVVSSEIEPTNYDHVLVSGDYLSACEKVEVDGSWLPVVGPYSKSRRTVAAMEFLRQKHPEAYAGLIQWLVNG